ncbi:MAG: PHP domain-containing protein [Acholeplasmatales bacterium]|nr:PHP domain-containing protein [Acholeplasmatales bacterium]
MLKNNYHTHMRFCNHAKGDVIDYVKYANELGMEELGMSDHGPIPLNHHMTDEEYKALYCYENMNLDVFELYLNQIEDAQLKYPNMRILKALECEYLYDNDKWYENLRKRLDYMILGVHFYEYENHMIDTYKDLNYDNVYSYVENVNRALSTGLYDYLAHPDLFFFEYKDKDGNWTFDQRCKDVTNKLIDLAVKYDVYFEINCNGVRFAKNKDDINMWRYPNIEFFKIVKEYQDKNPNKLKLILGCDAHQPEALDNENVKAVLKFVEDLGLKVLTKIEL